MVKLAVAIGLLLALLDSTSAAETTEKPIALRVLHFLPASSPVHTKILVPWTERIVAETGGRLRFEVYPAMQLGGRPMELYDMVERGMVDIVWTLPSYTPGRFPLMEIFELPFMMTTRRATSRAAWAYYEKFAREEFADVVPLSMHVIGAGAFHMRDKQIARLEDLKDRRIRVPSRQSGATLRRLGAIPVDMPAFQINAALRDDQIDGALANWDFATSSRVINLTKFDCELSSGGGENFQTSVIVVAMNKMRYTTLPPDLRAILDRNSGDALVSWLSGVWGDEEVEGRAAARALGNSVTEITPSEVERFKAGSATVIDEWIADVTATGKNGRELYKSAKELVAKFGQP